MSKALGLSPRRLELVNRLGRGLVWRAVSKGINDDVLFDCEGMKLVHRSIPVRLSDIGLIVFEMGLQKKSRVFIEDHYMLLVVKRHGTQGMLDIEPYFEDSSWKCTTNHLHKQSWIEWTPSGCAITPRGIEHLKRVLPVVRGVSV